MQVPSSPGGTVVPFPQAQQPQVPQVYLAMAAAQMHAEGRLFEPAPQDKGIQVAGDVVKMPPRPSRPDDDLIPMIARINEALGNKGATVLPIKPIGGK